MRLQILEIDHIRHVIHEVLQQKAGVVQIVVHARLRKLRIVLIQPPACINAKANETTLYSRVICYFARMEKRIIQLEMLSALQEEMLSTLNQEVFRQQQDLARLQRRISTLEEKLSELDQANEVGGNEKPPHY